MLRAVYFAGIILLAAASFVSAQTTQPIQPTMVEMKAMELAGIATFGSPEEGSFAKLWHQFPANVDNQPGLATVPAYGVSLIVPSKEKSKEFSYFAGLAVTDTTKVPAFLVRLPLPAGTYAVFPLAHGMPEGLKELGPMYNYIFKTWLPDSDYEVAAPLNIERYNWKAGTIELLIPVRKKL